MRKLCVSTKFTDQRIRWKYSNFCSDSIQLAKSFIIFRLNISHEVFRSGLFVKMNLWEMPIFWWWGQSTKVSPHQTYRLQFQIFVSKSFGEEYFHLCTIISKKKNNLLLILAWTVLFVCREHYFSIIWGSLSALKTSIQVFFPKTVSK